MALNDDNVDEYITLDMTEVDILEVRENKEIDQKI